MVKEGFNSDLLQDTNFNKLKSWNDKYFEKLNSSINELKNSSLEEFYKACRLINARTGNIITCGIGKSGIIANKAAASLSSTGSPCFYVHPSEAAHGDLGMINKGDVIILISYSGRSIELIPIIEYCKNLSIPIIAIVNDPNSVLAKSAEVVLTIPKVEEPTHLPAPFISTLLTLSICDLLNIFIIELNEFSNEKYSLLHPGGKIGSSYKLVADIMSAGEKLPLSKETSLMSDVIIEITNKKLGLCCIVNDNGELTGIITDGDLRRKMSDNILSKTAKEIMTSSPKTISSNYSIKDAFAIMKEKKITNLPVVDENSNLVGVIHVHDIIKIIGDE